MTSSDSAWISSGRGRPPTLTWSASLEGQLAGVDLAWETRCVYAADDSGGVYAFDPSGRMFNLSRGFARIEQLAWSAVGTDGVICTADRQLTWLDERLQTVWSRKLNTPTTALAISPFATMALVCLANHRNTLLRADRKELATFDSVRPFAHVAFIPSRAGLIAASADGVVCRYNLDGRLLWKTDLLQNVGDLCVRGDGQQILLACYQHGVTILGGDGSRQGAFVVSGPAASVTCGFDGHKLLLTTLDREICRLTLEGEPLWAAQTPSDVLTIRSRGLEEGAVVGLRNGRLIMLTWPELTT
jgi:hypothetical protein